LLKNIFIAVYLSQIIKLHNQTEYSIAFSQPKLNKFRYFYGEQLLIQVEYTISLDLII
jgi:hypothetical protein